MKGLFKTLQQRLLTLLLLAGLPTGLLLFGYVWQAHDQVILEQQRHARMLVDAVAGEGDAFIARSQQLLQKLSRDPVLLNPADADCERKLRQVLSLRDEYLNFAVARTDGELVCSARPLGGRVNIADRDYMQRVLTNKRFAIGSYQIDRVSRQPALGLAFPIVDPRLGRTTGVAIAMVSLEDWSRRLGAQTLPAGAVAFLADAQNRIIAHNPVYKRVIGLFAETYGYDTRQVDAETGVVDRESRDRDGEQRVHAYKPLQVLADEPRLVAGVTLPLKGAIEASREHLWQGLALVALSMLVMLGVVLAGLRSGILVPLEKLLDYTRSLEQGRLDKPSTVNGVAEVEALQAQISAMVEKRLAAESDLRDSEARFRSIAETIQDVFWVVTPDWRKVLYVNPAYEYIWQRPVETLYRAPNSWLGSVVQEDRQRVVDYLAELARGEHDNIVFPLFRIERRDGTLRWISTKGFPAHDSEGKLTSVVGIAEDVTERKQYEAELSEREAKYRLLVEHAEDLVIKVDTDGHFLFVSPSYCRTFGKSEYQLLGKAYLPLVHEDDQAATAEAMKRLYYPPFSVYLEQRAMTVEGWRWFGWSDTAVLDDHQQVVEIIGVGRDITQQKQTESALRESEARNRELVDNMSDGVAVVQRIGDTDDFLISNFNRAAERIAGYTRQQVIGQQLDVIFPGVKDLGLLETIRQVAKEGTPIRRPVGSYHDQRLDLWIEYYVFKLPSGEVVAVFRDATSEQRALEALRTSEEKFRGFFEDLSVGLVIADRDGIVQEANKAFAQMFGRERTQLTEASLRELLAAESRPEIGDRLDDLLDGRLEQYRFQASYQPAGERRLTANIAIGALPGAGGQQGFLYGIAEDVTALELAQSERNKLQRELMRTYRLEALGRLAGGIAHDFNNILGAISGFVELAVSRMGSADAQQIRGYLEKSLESSERARQLIKQLLIFSRGPEDQASKPQDFGLVVSNSMKMIKSLLPSSIGFDIHLAEEPFLVVCDPVQIEQVLLNLCINARDAMDGKGSIEVSLDSYRGRGEHCAICSEAVLGDWVSLLVRDSGSGISQNDIERIFEPFFTTKEGEKGTGLGLSVVHGIVSGYNGHILIDSAPTRGTGFRILFPLYTDAAEQTDDDNTAGAAIESATLTAGLRVLVVDDESAIRQLLREALLGDGYDVEVCVDGAAAWERLRGGAHGFDLMITDQTMPHMTGLELVAKLRAAGDALPVILCTGFSESVNEQVLQDLNIVHCLEKPVKLNRLRSTLHAVLFPRPAPKEATASAKLLKLRQKH